MNLRQTSCRKFGAGKKSLTRQKFDILGFFSSLESKNTKWCTRRESNPRPFVPKTNALSAELQVLIRKQDTTNTNCQFVALGRFRKQNHEKGEKLVT